MNRRTGYRLRRPSKGLKPLFDIIWLGVLFAMLIVIIILALLLAQIHTAQ